MVKMMAIMMYWLMLIKHPMITATSVVMTAVLVSIMAFSSVSTSWLAYVLSLTFVGGMMVAMVYVTSLVPNKKTMAKNQPKITMGLILPIMVLSSMKMLDSGFKEKEFLMYSFLWTSLSMMTIVVVLIMISMMTIVMNPVKPMKSNYEK